jgi:hypothetical protein
MEKEKVIEALNEFRVTATGEMNKEYEKYKSENFTFWLGNYFLEDESQQMAFPYKDSDKDLVDLVQFINKKYDFTR